MPLIQKAVWVRGFISGILVPVFPCAAPDMLYNPQAGAGWGIYLKALLVTTKVTIIIIAKDTGQERLNGQADYTLASVLSFRQVAKTAHWSPEHRSAGIALGLHSGLEEHWGRVTAK